jgi:ubiquinone/menaquinone biosynthesis C-methylase UbiE
VPAHAFDDLAVTYDAQFTDTVVGRALRAAVWSRLDEAFAPSDRVLELGCGTGEDAVRLAQRGVRVVATDASCRMIELARHKAVRHSCADAIAFHCVEMESLATCLDAEPFDGVLSNFGAINCVRDLPALASEVAARLVPGGRLFWVIMGRHAAWEWLWYLLRGQWRKAGRRLRAGGVPWRGLTISYPTPSEVTALLRPYFAIRQVTGLGLALPPSYASGWLERSPRSLRALAALEGLAQQSSILAGLSDHYIVEATRLPASQPA